LVPYKCPFPDFIVARILSPEAEDRLKPLSKKETVVHLKDTGALYDARHEKALSEISWSVTHGYARSLTWDSEAEKVRHQYQMHRFVWELEYGLPLPKTIDHINGNRLDNRIENLRAATLNLQALNNKGMGPRKKSGLPVGVYYEPNNKTNPYSSATSYKGKTYHLGCFPNPDKASAAYHKNRDALIKYEAAIAKGQSPEMPLIRKTALGRGGEVPEETQQKMAFLAESGRTVVSIARELGLSKPTVRKWLVAAGAPLHKEKLGRKPNPNSRRGRRLALSRFFKEINEDLSDD
jgi:hypothetical protein